MMVRRGDLGPLEEVAEGAFGRVYYAPRYRRRGDSARMVYKEFSTHVAEQARSAENAVSFRDLLSPADRAELDKFTAWPRAVVEGRDGIVGLVMPLIPDEFFFAAPSHMATKVRDLQWLIATPAQLAASGITAEFYYTERLMLLGQLVYAIGLLHEHGWVFGDLSFRNEAFAVNPPQIILLGCDGAADVHDLRRQQFHSLGWDPPECAQGNIQDQASDVYKLGLAILRCLNPGRGAATMRDPSRLAGRLDAAGAELVAQAMDPDPARRPTAAELYAYLRGAVPDPQRAIMPPAAALRLPARPSAAVWNAASSREVLPWAAGVAVVPAPAWVRPVQVPPPGAKIFLCYRREDTQGFARGIFESLAGKYGRESVFRDIDSTPAGVMYSTWIETKVGQCSVMVVLIGGGWLSVKDRAEQRRLDSPGDWVRQEIEAALRRHIPIIPVCVQGARMPSEDDLPSSIADLARFQSAEVTDSRWEFDIGLLTQAIDNLIASDYI
jgi:hypothetical protein